MRSCSRILVWIVSLSIILGVYLPSTDAAEGTINYEGTIVDVSLTDSTVTVRRGITSKTFEVRGGTSIVTEECGSESSLNDLRAGFNVEVTYSVEDGVTHVDLIRERGTRKELN